MSRQGQKIQGQNGKMIDWAKNALDEFAQAKRSICNMYLRIYFRAKKGKKMQPKATKFSGMHFFADHVSRKTDVTLMGSSIVPKATSYFQTHLIINLFPVHVYKLLFYLNLR